MAPHKSKDDDEETTKALAALSYILVVALIGVPLWWTTTRVYRVDLPYDDIHALQQQQIVIPVKVTVVLFRENLSKSQLDDLSDHLQAELKDKTVSVIDDEPVNVADKVRVDVTFDVRHSYDEERMTIDASTSLTDADERLKRTRVLDEVGALQVMLLPSDTALVADDAIHLGINRVIFARVRRDMKSTCVEVARRVRDVVIDPQDLQKISVRISGFEKGDDKSSRRQRPKATDWLHDYWTQSVDWFRDGCTTFADWLTKFWPGLGALLKWPLTLTEQLVEPAPESDTVDWNSPSDKISMTTLPSSSAVDVTFTLILPDPAVLHLRWDIAGAKCAYLDPLAKKIGSVLSLNVNSQVLHLLKLDIHGHYKTQRKHYALGADQLPHIINPIEGKLGSHVSTNPSLNFVVYIPPANQSPLQIYDSAGQPSSLNAFLVPRWGGFLLYNVPWVSEATGGEQVATNASALDMRRVMGVFVEQLRSLLGVRALQASADIIYSPLDRTSIRDWEYDAMLRLKLAENLLKASSTLLSLAQLLEDIGNMVISDEVAEQVFKSVDKLAASRLALSEGNTMDAFLLSKESLVASEAAFFDPSMLAFLYFPDDQKYAIYVPLMLPVSLPLVLSLFPIFAWFKLLLPRSSKGKKRAQTSKKSPAQ